MGILKYDFDVELYPGVTIGFRKYKHFTYGYTDLQFSGHYVGGGIGKYWIIPNANKSQKFSLVKGIRTKFWVGLFVLGTYDFHKIIGNPISHSFGTFGVFPIVRSER